jgi:hypothetical protein
MDFALGQSQNQCAGVGQSAIADGRGCRTTGRVGRHREARQGVSRQNGWPGRPVKTTAGEPHHQKCSALVAVRVVAPSRELYQNRFASRLTDWTTGDWPRSREDAPYDGGSRRAHRPMGETQWQGLAFRGHAPSAWAGITNLQGAFRISSNAELTHLYSNQSQYTDIPTGTCGTHRATLHWDFCTGVGVPKGGSIAASIAE